MGSGIRGWATAAAVAQVVFVVAWLVAPSWQGPRYDVLVHRISEMYATGAPGAWVLVVVFMGCGAAVTGFAAWSLWPVLRPGGRPAAVGTALLGLSIYGLEDLLAPDGRLPCSRAEPGCDAASQLADVDGVVHNVLGAAGLLLVVVGAPVLGIAMRRTPGWEHWAPWPFGFAALFLAMGIGTGLAGSVGLTGAAERVLATTGAAAIAVLALAVRRKAPREL